MDTMHHKLLGYGVLLMLLCAGLCAPSYGQMSAEEVRSRYPVRVEAEPTQVLVGEPVVIQVTLTNNSGADIPQIPIHRFERVRNHGRRHFDIIDPKGAVTHREGTDSIPMGLLMDIPHGESYTEKIVLYRRHRRGTRLLWPEPGEYLIQMVPHELYSAVTITVTEPAGRDAEAFPLWEGYCGVTDISREEQEALGLRLMAEYADTVYGQWAIFFHTDAMQVSEQAWDMYRAGREPDTQEDIEDVAGVQDFVAATLSERLRYLIEDCPDFPYKDECMLRLARAMSGDARRIQYQEILRIYPDTPVAYLAAEELAKN